MAVASVVQKAAPQRSAKQVREERESSWREKIERDGGLQLKGREGEAPESKSLLDLLEEAEDSDNDTLDMISYKERHG